ncbi:hypothetical protein POSPLADRAFT_1134102, partial [Postia placenta MAD-698-R-SB12]
AGRGLFATQPCSPSATLFTVPGKALINTRTLAAIYPGGSLKNLTAVQQISMHLLLHRPAGDADSADPAFGPYISTMPRDFDSHPLTWLRRLENATQMDPLRTEETLLKCMSPSTRSALQLLWSRFQEDWNMVRNLSLLTTSSRPEVMRTNSESIPGFYTDYLWGWLNVNTRCIYYPLRDPPSDKDNLTLCPILDFANHGVSSAQIIPQIQALKNRRPGSHINEGNYAFTSGADGLEPDSQLFLRYGGHANKTLLVEYGFVSCISPDAIAAGDFRGEVDVQDIIEDMLSDRPDGDWLRKTLEEEGYWGDWTLDSSPPPAHPSYRLITTLRLCQLVGESVGSEGASSSSEAVVQIWRDVLNGQRDVISVQNEVQWRESLRIMCETIQQRAQTGLRDTVSALPGADGWSAWMRGNILTLWREELEVATGVIDSLNAGEEY